MALSIIGAGFGRTGTLSLKTALDHLGVGPCYHMMEVRKNPGHSELWKTAADGETTDWDHLFGDYQATVDWPSCYFWRELSEHYPDAKVILTHRDPERWYQSVSQTIYQSLTRPITDEETARRLAMPRKIILQQTFDGRFEDKDYAIEVFQKNIDEVKKTIPAERLLVYEVAQGWEPLCEFLGLPVPEQEFPKVNTTSEFLARK